MLNIKEVFDGHDARVTTNRTASDDLAVRATLHHQFPGDLLGLDEAGRELSRPFADAQAQRIMRAAQEDVLQHPEVLLAMNAAVNFVDFVMNEWRRSLGLLTPLALGRVLARQGSETETEKLLGMGVFQDLNNEHSAFLSAVRKLESVPDVTSSELTVYILKNIQEFISKISKILEKYSFQETTKKRWFKHNETIVHLAVNGKKEEFSIGLRELKIELEKYCREFEGNNDPQAAGYWMKLLIALGEIRKQCAAVMGEARTTTDGSMSVSRLYNPELGQRQAAATTEGSGEESTITPHELLNLSPDQRLVVITGPTGAGKTTLLRAIAHTLLYKQVGMSVFAQDAKLPPIDTILTYQPREDTGSEGMGRFAGECRRLADLCQSAGPQTVVFIDELLTAMSQLPCVGEMAKIIIDRLIALGARVFMVTHNPHIVNSLNGTAGAVFLKAKEGAQHEFVESSDFAGDMEVYTGTAWGIFHQSFPEDGK